MANHFTADNTNGYSQAELDRLNAILDAMLNAAADREPEMPEWVRRGYKEYLAETMLADFDTELAA